MGPPLFGKIWLLMIVGNQLCLQSMTTRDMQDYLVYLARLHGKAALPMQEQGEEQGTLMV